jgi:hypothetical protein
MVPPSRHRPPKRKIAQKPEKEREDRSKGREIERIQEIFTVDFRLKRHQKRITAYTFG